MKEKSFKPMKAPNEEVITMTNIGQVEIEFPLLASYKLDGIRCLFKSGEVLSNSLKQIPNMQVREKFEALRKYSENPKSKPVLDGELYIPGIPFQMILSCVMTEDYNAKTSQKKWEKLCTELKVNITREEALQRMKYYCFDTVLYDGFTNAFSSRIKYAETVQAVFPDLIVLVEHWSVFNKEEVVQLFEQALAKGFEGLMLRLPDGLYKFGRATWNEGLVYKFKPFETFDGKIIGVIQSTEVDPNAEKKINELGYSVTSKKQGDRILIEKACAFLVKYEGQDLKVNLTMTDPEKIEVWKNRDSYIGQWIEYKAMKVGMKDLPRHPNMIRFREPKD